MVDDLDALRIGGVQDDAKTTTRTIGASPERVPADQRSGSLPWSRSFD
jgi:hypothetical protein